MTDITKQRDSPTTIFFKKDFWVCKVKAYVIDMSNIFTHCEY